MVVTKIEAGKYSIVTASGLKFEAKKQLSHCWYLRYTKTNELKWSATTLKECVEVAGNCRDSGEHNEEKAAEPVKLDAAAETDEPAETEKADEPKSNFEKILLDFVAKKIVLNVPTQEVCDLLMKECAKLGLKWQSGDLARPGYPNITDTNTCISYENDAIGFGPAQHYALRRPLLHIVTITTADFDKPKKEFTKADLKTGMVVECRNHAKYMVIEGRYECEYGMSVDLMLIAEGADWMDGNRYHNDLTNDQNYNFNIDKVYKRKMQGLGWMLNKASDENLIWQRKPEYDWSKAEMDMPMLGRNGERLSWHKRYFAKYENGIVSAWSDGCTSWTTDKTCQWAYVLPYKGNEHLVEGEDK